MRLQHLEQERIAPTAERTLITGPGPLAENTFERPLLVCQPCASASLTCRPPLVQAVTNL